MQGNNDTRGTNPPVTSGQKPSGLSWSMPSAQASQQTRPGTPAPGNQQQGQKNTTQPKPSQPAPKGAGTNGKSKRLKLIAGGVVVGVLAVWALGGMFKNDAPEPRITTADETSNEATPAEEVGGATTFVSNTGTIAGLSVPSVQDAGLEVAVASVKVSQPTWVVVYESRGGQPGNALGAALFFAESKSGVVRLLRATLPGQTYFVGQSIDDGDRVFSLQADERVRDVQGNLVWTTFSTR